MELMNKKLGLLAAGLIIIPALAGCGADSTPTTAPAASGSATGTTAAAMPSGPKDNIKILVGGLSKQIYLPNMLAKQLGYFDEQNLNVELIDEQSGQSAEEEVLAGNVDAGSGSYNHTIELQAKGKQIMDVVQLLISPGEAEVVASKEAGQIKTAADLKGKNLGVTELGSGTQTITQYILTKNGVPADQVQFVPVGAGDTFIAAIKQGKIDAGMTTEPTISRLLQSGDGKVLLDLRTPDATRSVLGADYPFICIFMNASYVSAHKDITQRLVNAYVKTLKFIHTHTAAEVADKMPADYYAGNKDLYVTALTNQYAMFSPDGKMPDSGPPFTLDFENQINPDVKATKIDLAKTFTNEFANNAK